MNRASLRNLAVDSVLVQGHSIAVTAMNLGVPCSQICEWLAAAEIDASQPIPKHLRNRLAAIEKDMHSLKIKLGQVRAESRRFWAAQQL